MPVSDSYTEIICLYVAIEKVRVPISVLFMVCSMYNGSTVWIWNFDSS
uniref:Uncharacterized protein n=1 Tax=Arundo donax TaxID=35708 RepID=A0A0A8YG73_ARUDO